MSVRIMQEGKRLTAWEEDRLAYTKVGGRPMRRPLISSALRHFWGGVACLADSLASAVFALVCAGNSRPKGLLFDHSSD